MQKRTTVAKTVKKRALETSTASARRVDDLVDLVRRRLAHITEDFYDMGVALRELASPKLYTAVGCTSFEDLLAKYQLGSHTQAYRAMAVVKAFPNRDEAIALGFERCAAVLSYASATKKPDVAREITGSGSSPASRLPPSACATSTRKRRASARSSARRGRPPSARSVPHASRAS